jgi:hypothetical protein
MTVPFQELGGSPVEQYGLDGFRATRRFLIAWEDRDAFAVEVLGAAAPHGGSSWVPYPGKDSVFAVKLRYEPLDPQSPDVQAIAGLTEGLNSYSGSFAKATVDYRTFTGQDRDDGPTGELGTHLTYRMTYAAEEVKLLPQGWQWEDQPSTPVSADLEVIQRVPVTEHHLTWHRLYALSPYSNHTLTLENSGLAKRLACGEFRRPTPLGNTAGNKTGEADSRRDGAGWRCFRQRAAAGGAGRYP